MKNILYISLFISFLCFSYKAGAQEKLTLEQAIVTGLKNNYDISIARNNIDIAKNNVSYGNAGALPSLNLMAGQSIANTNTHQVYNTGSEINRNGVGANGLNAGLSLNWTIFQGFRMYATYGKLKEFEKQGEDNARIQVENTVSQIISYYFDIVRQGQYMKAINGNLAIYEERLKIADAKFKIGSASRLDFLQSKVDFNAQKSNLLQQKTVLNNAKSNLNQLLARDINTPFEVEDTIIINYKPNYDELKGNLRNKNNAIQSASRNINIANFSLREWNAYRYPNISYNLGYNFTRTQNAVGLILLNQNLGLNSAITFNWTLFNGFNLNRNIENARIQVQNAKLDFSNIQSKQEAALARAYESFQNYLQIMALEEENYGLAKENVVVALERFRLGNSTTIELKQAQQSYEDAQTRLVTARYNTKIAESELMRLNGELAKSFQP